MLEKVYEQGYLDYHRLIIKNYKALELDETEALVLIAIMDLYKDSTTKKIKVPKIVLETKLPKSVIENALGHLLELQIYEIFIVSDKNGFEDEAMSLTPLFIKLENLLFVETNENTTDEKKVIDLIEGELKRPLTPIEYETVTLWFKDNYTFDEINQALINSVKTRKFTFSNIEREIIASRKKAFTSPAISNPKTDQALDKIFNMMKK